MHESCGSEDDLPVTLDWGTDDETGQKPACPWGRIPMNGHRRSTTRIGRLDAALYRVLEFSKQRIQTANVVFARSLVAVMPRGKKSMSKLMWEVFRFCPRCGAAIETTGNPMHCSSCDYTHFFGPCSAVAGILTDADGRVLFLRRQKDPGKGKLGLPGGFVDAGESAEDALKREAFEEMNLRVKRMEYLASFPNNYTYQGVTLAVTDMFFTCEVESFESIAAEESEVAGWHFCKPDEATLEQMAFLSNRKAVEAFINRSKAG